MSFRQANRIDIYNAAGVFVWNKYRGAKCVSVYMISGGQGGKGGILAATLTTAAQGQQGGGGGAYAFATFPAVILGNTENVTVGAGGLGTVGAAVPAIPLAGGISKFGLWLFAGVGTGATNSIGIGSTQSNATIPGYGGGKGANATAGQKTFMGGAGGGAGGGITAGTGALIIPFVGGDVGDTATGSGGVGYAGLITGGIIGVAGPAGDGGNGNSLGVNSIVPGSGGGGGAAWNISGRAGNGGLGGFPGGGGGGGGAGVTGVTTAGNGANGADGIVMVITSF